MPSLVVKYFTVVAVTWLAMLLAACNSTTGTAYTPSYKADVPDNILTPNKMNSVYLGDIHFFDGIPSPETADKAFNFVDTARAVEAFLSGMPLASLYGLLEGIKKGGVIPNRNAIMFENMMDANTLFLSPNATTPYVLSEIDVKAGPVVVESPGPVLGFVDNAFFRHVADLGFTGADKGQGGKYLFVGPGYKGDIPDGYHVYHSKNYRNWLLMRLIIKDGDLQGAAKSFNTGFNIYPLALAANPPKAEVLSRSGTEFNTIHANNIDFYSELNEVIQYEPADSFNPQLVGLFASIGI